MTTARWVLCLALAAMAGCATAKVASPESDATAKQFTPPAGKANLYVARAGNSSATAASFDVAVDGRGIGAISPGTFVLVALDPGRHLLSASTFESSSRASFDAEAGKNYFFEVTTSSGGAMGRPSLGLVLLEEMGKMMVRQSRRAQGPQD